LRQLAHELGDDQSKVDQMISEKLKERLKS